MPARVYSIKAMRPVSDKTKIIRAGDIVVFVVLGASALFMIWAGAGAPKSISEVEVSVNSDVVHRASLGQNFTQKVLGPLGITTVMCLDGYVWVKDSCCPNKLCVKTGKIHTQGQTIVCVPNRVVVRIVGADAVDAITM